jgi:hypothetical protein
MEHKNPFGTEKCFVVSVWVQQKGQGQIFALRVKNWLQLGPFNISCGRLTSLISSQQGAIHSANHRYVNISPGLEKSGLSSRRKSRKKRSVQLQIQRHFKLLVEGK